jgi:hypothetical protein
MGVFCFINLWIKRLSGVTQWRLPTVDNYRENDTWQCKLAHPKRQYWTFVNLGDGLQEVFTETVNLGKVK